MYTQGALGIFPKIIIWGTAYAFHARREHPGPFPKIHTPSGTAAAGRRSKEKKPTKKKHTKTTSGGSSPTRTSSPFCLQPLPPSTP